MVYESSVHPSHTPLHSFILDLVSQLIEDKITLQFKLKAAADDLELEKERSFQLGRQLEQIKVG